MLIILDILGNLRLDPTNGNSKIIINAVAPATASDDFYCNGNGHFNGTLRVSVLTSDGDINADGCNADTFNSHIITNDIIYNHNNVEYMRFNATDDELQLSKNIDVGSSTLICNNFDSGLSDVVFNLNTNEFLRFQLSDNTVRVPNTKSFLSQNIFTDIVKPLAFSNDISLQGQNTTNDNYEEYMEIHSTDKTIYFNKDIDVNENILMNLNKRLYLNDTSGSERYIVSTFRSGTPSFNQLDIANENSINGRIRLMIDTEENVIIENSQLYSKRVITAVAGVKSNTIDTNTDVNLTFSRSGTEFLRFDKTDDNITCSKEIVAGDAVIVDVAKKLTMRPSLESGVNIFDIRNLHPVVDNPMIRFRVGEGGGDTIITEMTNSNVLFKRNVVIQEDDELKTNTINSNGDNDLTLKRDDVSKIEIYDTRVHVNDEFRVYKTSDNSNFRIQFSNQLDCYVLGGGGNTMFLNYLSKGNVFLGSDQAVKPTITVNKFSSGNGNAFEVGGNSVFSGTVSTNTLNSEGDNDLVFQRNGIEYFRLDDLTGTDILNVANDEGVSASYVFGNRFWNRSFSSDTTFFGSNVAGDDRVEYMKWNYLSQSVDYNAPIDNTGLLITGNIVDTTVSDERLKTNIKDVESNFTKCVKHVKVKTFEYTNEKNKDNDKYGFIAQNLLANLPKEFKSIVKENKEKDSDEKYLSINYMKLSVVLWGCCQEQQSKIEYLESKLFEAIARVEALEKPKAKSKAKSKANNVD